MTNRYIKQLVFVGALSAVGSAHAERLLEEVIVTAQKRAESLQDVAGSISALDARQIELRGLSTAEDLFQAIPGMNFAKESGTTLITIRGIGLQVETGVAEPGVASHIDGMYQARAAMHGVETVDLERIEVLRGPQGTLYGRNATGGVVNFITAKPSKEFEGEVTAGIGSWDKVIANGYISGPIVQDKLLGRLSVSYSDQDGYYNNLAAGADSSIGDDKRETVRAALRYLASDDVTVDFSYQHTDQEYQPFQPRQDASDLNIAQLVPPPFGVPAGSFIPDGAHNTAFPAGFPYGEKQTDAATLTVNWDINDDVTFKSITGYIDFSGGPDHYPANTYLNPDRSVATIITSIGWDSRLDPSFPDLGRSGASESWSQEFNLVGSSFDDKLDWTIGLYHFEEDFSSVLPIAFLGSAALNALNPALNAGFGTMPGTLTFRSILSEYEEEASASGIFLDTTYSVTEAFRVNAGIRFGRDKKDTLQRQQTTFGNNLPVPLPTAFGVSIPVGGFLPIENCGNPLDPTDIITPTSIDRDSTSPKLRIEWDANEDLLVYAQWQKGFKVGGVNDASCGQEFDHEEIVSYESGFKATLLDGSMTLNGSVYYYDYEDLQVLTVDETGTAGLVANIPEAEIYGGELELQWLASDVVSVDASIAIAESEVTESERYFDTRTAITNPAGAVLDIKGNQVPRNPELTASLGVNLNFDTGLGGLTLRGEAYYSDETQFRLFDNPEDLGPSYTVANLYATLRMMDDKLTLRAYAKNVTDEEYIYNILFGPVTSGGGRFAPPRHYGLEATYRF